MESKTWAMMKKEREHEERKERIRESISIGLLVLIGLWIAMSK